MVVFYHIVCPAYALIEMSVLIGTKDHGSIAVTVDDHNPGL